MGANSLIWLCIGAGVVLFLMVLVILLVFRPSAADRHEFRPECRRSPSPAASPPSGEIPYGVDRRAMPISEDLERLLPQRVGPFERRSVRLLGDIHRDPIYAEYQSGNVGVFVELGICGDPGRAQEGLLTAKRETDAEFPDEPQQFVCGQDPSFLKTSNKLGAFMGWTRGGYYFSAHAKGGETDLNVFMEAFPY